MSRLIDADKYFISIVNAKSVEYCIEKLNSMPTVDAVTVVRCKDCKHRPKKDGYYNDVCPCATTDDPYIDWMPEDDWFCANGEKVTE